MRAVSLTLGLPSSLSEMGRPPTVCVGHAFSRLNPARLTAGCVRGMTPPVNSPPLATDPVPVAGQREFAAPRHQGLNNLTGAPPEVVREKSPVRCRAVGQTYCRLRVVDER